MVLGVAVSVVAGWVLVAGRALVVSVPIAQPDVIVSLASHEWERLPAAAAAARRAPGAIVLLTLPTHVSRHNCHDCPNRAARLARLGVAPQRIRVLPLSVEGTIGEAQACAAFLRTTGAHSILVVTTPYHTRRALAVFRARFRGTGVGVGIEPASRFSAAQPATWWLAAFDRWYVAYEWAALAYYAAWHGIWPELEGADVGRST